MQNLNAPQRYRLAAQDLLEFLPPIPQRIEDTGLPYGLLQDLVLRRLFLTSSTSGMDLCDALHLPWNGVVETLIGNLYRDKLVEFKGGQGYGRPYFDYSLTELGRDRARDAMERCSYVGPAPVPLPVFVSLVRRQTREVPRVTRSDLEAAFHDMVLEPSFMERLGPAVNSVRSLFLYGAPGNGKTSVAERIATILKGEIFVPHALEVDAQIIKVYDPLIHREVQPLSGPANPYEDMEKERTPTDDELDMATLAGHEALAQLQALGGLEELELDENATVEVSLPQAFKNMAVNRSATTLTANPAAHPAANPAANPATQKAPFPGKQVAGPGMRPGASATSPMGAPTPPPPYPAPPQPRVDASAPAAAAPRRDESASPSMVNLPPFDRRFVLCYRPHVVVGGELTLEALDLTWNTTSRYYEAPFQVKACCGMMLIDDFGRQKVHPTDLLNRWIVPLEKRIDFLTLTTGKKFEMPFELLVIFSTNLDPAKLVDEAFLRRIRYKLEIPNPSERIFRGIFRKECQKQGVRFDPASLEHLVQKYYLHTGRAFRGCHPRDILQLIVDLCKFAQLEPALSRKVLEQAAESYFVHMEGDQATLATGGKSAMHPEPKVESLL